MLKYFFILTGISCSHLLFAQQSEFTSALHAGSAKGWNTWSYGSMLSWVSLPERVCMRVNFRHAFIGPTSDPDYFLEDIYVDKKGVVRPVAHTYDGSYTELMIRNWFGNSIRVQSTASGSDNVVLITPVSVTTPFHVELQAGLLWNTPGQQELKGNSLEIASGDRTIRISSTNTLIKRFHNYTSPYLITSGDSAVAFYTGTKKTLAEINELIAAAETKFHKSAGHFGEKAEAYKALQTVMGWNTIYDAEQGRVITPVTRAWNEAWQGYVLFEWDTFFGALIAALGSKELAYCNALAVVKGPRPGLVGFFQMPGVEAVQSQPPVGAFACWTLFEKFGDKQFLAEVYPELKEWNEWWIANRLNKGYLTYGASWPNGEVKHGLLESGLDNSPMYDDVRMENVGANSMFNLADVGLNSLYVADCKYLARIAAVLGIRSDEKVFRAREQHYRNQVQKLWDADKSIFLNKFLDSQKSSDRLSPTLFYPLFAGIATPAQAKLMISKHLNNPSEFKSDYMIPSIAFNDKSFDNEYWRGSVWGPMNFLVYMGLRQYDREAAKALAINSYSQFMTAWNKHHYVFENINSSVGPGRVEDQVNSDPFYHWGGLMALPMFIEDNQY